MFIDIKEEAFTKKMVYMKQTVKHACFSMINANLSQRVIKIPVQLTNRGDLMRRLSLIIVLFCMIVCGVEAREFTALELARKIDESKKNLARLDYQYLDQELKAIKALEDEVSNAPLERQAELKVELNQRLWEANLKTYESPKIETRAIWIDNIYLSKIRSLTDVKQMMAWLASLNFNVVIPDVYNQGQSIYPSKVVSQFYNYRVLYDGDILADMVAEAHAQGLEIHPLIVTFGLDAGFEFEQFLDRMDWFDKDINGNFVNIYGQAFLSPAVPQLREQQIALVKEIASYGVDGLQLDYIRFSTGFGYGDYISNLFKSFYGVNPKELEPNSSLIPRYLEFKGQFISAFVERAAKEVAAIDPHAVVSAAVASPYSWGYYDLAQDWKHWADNRFLHSLMLMSYTLTAKELQTITSEDLQYSENKITLLPGLGLYNWGAEELLNQITVARELPFTGQACFSAVHVKAEMEEVLQKGPYREKSQSAIRNPQQIAAGYLQDLDLRIAEVGLLANLQPEIIADWQRELQQVATEIQTMQIRSFPERDLQESDSIEYGFLKKLIEELEAMYGKAKELGKPGKRIQLEIVRALSLLEMLQYLSGPYNYRSIKY